MIGGPAVDGGVADVERGLQQRLDDAELGAPEEHGHQAQVLGQAYGQLAVYELEGTIRRVVACDSVRVLVQAVVCQRERQPPTPTPSPWP